MFKVIEHVGHSCTVDNLENKYEAYKKEMEIVYNPVTQWGTLAAF